MLPTQKIEWFEAEPDQQVTFKVKGSDVGGAYSVSEGILPPFSGPPLHIHENADEAFEILEGRLRFICEGEEFDAPAGTTVLIPKGAQHTWKNIGNSYARALAIFSPAGPEHMFLEFASTPLGRLPQMALRYGCRIIGPPL